MGVGTGTVWGSTAQGAWVRVWSCLLSTPARTTLRSHARNCTYTPPGPAILAVNLQPGSRISWIWIQDPGSVSRTRQRNVTFFRWEVWCPKKRDFALFFTARNMPFWQISQKTCLFGWVSRPFLHEKRVFRPLLAVKNNAFRGKVSKNMTFPVISEKCCFRHAQNTGLYVKLSKMCQNVYKMTSKCVKK